MENDTGLKDALSDGDAVILSSGALAMIRGSYPKGYRGDVRIALDGVEESERASALTATRWPVSEGVTAAENEGSGSEMGQTRAPSRRMED